MMIGWKLLIMREHICYIVSCSGLCLKKANIQSKIIGTNVQLHNINHNMIVEIKLMVKYLCPSILKV